MKSIAYRTSLTISERIKTNIAATKTIGTPHLMRTMLMKTFSAMTTNSTVLIFLYSFHIQAHIPGSATKSTVAHNCNCRWLLTYYPVPHRLQNLGSRIPFFFWCINISKIAANFPCKIHWGRIPPWGHWHHQWTIFSLFIQSSPPVLAPTFQYFIFSSLF